MRGARFRDGKLCSCAGWRFNCCGAIITANTVTEDELKLYSNVMRKFDEYFKIRRNVINERAKFNRRDQAVGESAEQYTYESLQIGRNVVSRVPDSLTLRRESGQILRFVIACPRNPWHVNWFIYCSDVMWLPAKGLESLARAILTAA